MTELKARDLMTAEVVTVPPETPVLAMARLLADRGISAVPVVDATGKVVGIVTEADLIRRLAGMQDKPASFLASLFRSHVTGAERYARTHGLRAEDVMTREVICADPDMPASQVARLMEDRGIRRVVVQQDGKLRGMVSRADLLRALVGPLETGGAALTDEQLRKAVLAAMKQEPWADTFYTLVDVKDGVVEFHGFSTGAAVQRGLRVLAENVPGVKGVVDGTQPMPASLFGAS